MAAPDKDTLQTVAQIEASLLEEPGVSEYVIFNNEGRGR
jgi:hypothetical protein